MNGPTRELMRSFLSMEGAIARNRPGPMILLRYMNQGQKVDVGPGWRQSSCQDSFLDHIKAYIILSPSFFFVGLQAQVVVLVSRKATSSSSPWRRDLLCWTRTLGRMFNCRSLGAFRPESALWNRVGCAVRYSTARCRCASAGSPLRRRSRARAPSRWCRRPLHELARESASAWQSLP